MTTHLAAHEVATDPFQCPDCGVAVTANGVATHRSGCRMPCRLVAGCIVDFLGGADAAADVLGWPAEVWSALERHAGELISGGAIGDAAAEPLRQAGLLDTEGRATERGRVVAYHVVETEWQRRGDVLRDRVVELAGVDTESRLLDVGCGAGTTLQHLREGSPRERVGVDIDLTALAVGRRLHGDEGPTFVRAGALALPFADGRFTHILSRVALNYVSQAPALREMVRVLAPGGWLALRFEALGFDLLGVKAARGVRAKVARTVGLLSGVLYTTLGVQPPLGRVCGKRCFASAYRLKKELRRLGCEVRGVEVVTRSPLCLGFASQKVLLAQRVRAVPPA